MEIFILILLSALVLLISNVVFKQDYPLYLQIVFALNLFFLYGRAFFSLFYRIRINRQRSRQDLSRVKGKISVVIPCYNESVDVIHQLFDSLSKQTLPPYEVLFIDDHSSNHRAYKYAKKYSHRSSLNLIVKKQPQNMGKLRAIYRGIKESTGDYLLFVDADGCVSTNTLHDMLAPIYFDDKVGGTCGRVVPLNEDDNALTKMQTVLYENAYNQGRQYQSFFNKVLVCSGTISMFRAKALRTPKALHLLLKSWLSRRERYTGDDIAMTNIVLRQHYKTLYVGSAVCYTTVPKRLKDFFVQQLRWLRDAYTSYLEELGSIITRPLFFLLETQETFYWLISLFSLVLFIVSDNIILSTYAIMSMFLFDLSGTLLDNYYLIFIKRDSLFMVLIRHYEYTVLVIAIRIVSLLTVLHQKWSHDTQKG